MACVTGDSRIELLPITSSGVGIPPVFARAVPRIDPNGVPLQEQKKRAQFLEAADAAIKDVLNATKPFDHSDPIGTLYAAGEALHRPPPEGKRVVIVIANGWQQTKNIDIFVYRKNPAAQADRVIDFLRQQNALPNLAGTNVVLHRLRAGRRRPSDDADGDDPPVRLLEEGRSREPRFDAAAVRAGFAWYDGRQDVVVRRPGDPGREGAPMAVQPQIAYRDVEASPALERLIQAEAAKLERFFHGIVSCRVLIEHSHRRHKHGSPFNVRIDLSLPGADSSS